MLKYYLIIILYLWFPFDKLSPHLKFGAKPWPTTAEFKKNCICRMSNAYSGVGPTKIWVGNPLVFLFFVWKKNSFLVTPYFPCFADFCIGATSGGERGIAVTAAGGQLSGMLCSGRCLPLSASIAPRLRRDCRRPSPGVLHGRLAGGVPRIRPLAMAAEPESSPLAPPGVADSDDRSAG